MADANVRIPAGARDRLAAVAAGEGLSLRAYLAKLAEQAKTPREREADVAKTMAVLKDMNGYDPTPGQLEADRADLHRRMREAGMTP